MKRYIRRRDCDPEEIERIIATEAEEVDINTHDFSKDSDDTYYTFDSLEEFRRWLAIEED